MGFSESTKKEVREKAAFRCCRCQKIGVEVHHILPEEYGGTDDIENAAPLCPNCHNDFGPNPEKRKAITEMRDWWYKKAKEMFGPAIIPESTIQELNDNLLKWNKGLSDFNRDIKPLLAGANQTLINTVTPTTASEAITGVIKMAVPLLKMEGYGRANLIRCKGCGEFVDHESNYCPKCGIKLR
jgi:hypothetical protein